MAVGLHRPVARYEGQILAPSLGDEHTIEGIAVVQWQPSVDSAMGQPHRKQVEAGRHFQQVRINRYATKSLQYCDFPNGYDADMADYRVIKYVPLVGRQRLRFGALPNNIMSIDKNGTASRYHLNFSADL